MVLLKEARVQEDVDLVALCQAGDATAFDEIVRRYKDRIYSLLYRFLGNHEDALDVAQEVFVRAYQGIGGFAGHAKVYTWLYAIAANLARNRLRDQGRKGRNRGASLEALQQDAPGAIGAAPESSPRAVAERRELEAALAACLEALPEVYRLAFVLRTFEGLSYEEIAVSGNCPRGTVKSRLNQARHLLGECLKSRGVLDAC